MNIQIQEIQENLIRMTAKMSTSTCQKSRQDFESSKKVQLVNTYKGNPISLTADFSAENLETRKECDKTFKRPKERKNCQPRHYIQQNNPSEMKDRYKNFHR